ncbi:MAG: UTP--glucose-1-phosphate uridylyltransferase [Planctomycetota bacterium]|nr:UTP--glucose-1-phosphate uridylyltransferase [Planctomycetota bacterium]
MTTIESEARLRADWERAGQGHVFQFWSELDASARSRLVACLLQIDLTQVAALGALARDPTPPHGAHRFEPPDVCSLARLALDARGVERARARGVARLRSGSVAALLVAGGQASRLGYDGPKGAFPVAPVSGRTLFEIFARRMIAARERFGARPMWYVMTSVGNDTATRAFFAEREWFGLDPNDVFFFTQAILPALDRAGRVLMSAKDEVFLAPNGHGGTLAALAESGALAHARARGVETFSYFQVDNPLALPFDPLFIGLHAENGAQMSSKVVSKRDAAEKVGVLGRVDGKLSCVEYSDLPSLLREARNERGELVFGAGNIAVHTIERSFVEELTRGGLRLPWHTAAKSMNVIDSAGQPTRVDGFKFETFVFDALAFVERSVTLEVDRACEFSPVKNKSGEDSAQTARAAQCSLHADWVRRANRPLPPPDEYGVHPVEIDPVLAEDAETFAQRAPARPIESERGHLWS